MENVKIKTENVDADSDCNTVKFVIPDVKLIKNEDKPEKTKLYLPCHLCARKFVSHIRFESHLKLHAEEDTLKFHCKTCNYLYATKQNLKTHLASNLHTRHKRYFCGICHMRFSNEWYLKRHKASRTGICGTCKCTYCGKKFNSIDLLRYHLRTEGCRSLTCHLCDRSFISAWHITHHMKSCEIGVLNGGKCTCTSCRRLFNTFEELLLHNESGCKQRKKSRVLTYCKCNYCPKEFKSMTNLRAHEMRCHRQAVVSNHWKKRVSAVMKTHECKICGYTTGYQHCYKMHMDWHKKRAMLNCSVCEKKFRYRKHLRDHIKETHHKVICNQCGVECSSEFTMKLHMKTHNLLSEDSPGLLCLLN